MRILVSARARADVFRIHSYLFERNPSAADRAIVRIERKLEQLGQFPFIGPERPGLAAGIRVAVVGTHLIIYRVDEAAVTIVRVIDGRMDVDEEFRK